MTDAAPRPVPPPQPPPIDPGPLADERQMAFIVYIAYLASHVIPFAGIAGLVLAYINRETAPDWLKSHYTFQIRTFWIGLLYWAASIVLCVVLVGVLLIFATLAWGLARNVMGLVRLLERQPYPKPETWLV